MQAFSHFFGNSVYCYETRSSNRDEDDELITMVSDEDLYTALNEYNVKELLLFDE